MSPDDLEARQAVDAAPIVLDQRERAARAAAARRRGLVLASLAGGVVVIAALWFFVLRDTANTCARWLGDPDDLAAYTGGRPLRAGYAHDGSYGCHQSYVVGTKLGDAIELSTERMRGAESQLLESRRRDEAARAYSDKITLALPGAGGDAFIFVASTAKAPSVAAMEADAVSRVGHARDPMGDMLASLPPAQHVALFRADATTMVSMRFDRDVFEVDAVKALVLAAAKRARQ